MGLGGFGFKGKNLVPNLKKIPTTKPDFILQGSTYPGQAFLYRLSGDLNSIHIDPKISSVQKFERPILHGTFYIYIGLCSYGIIARIVVQGLLKNNSSLIKSYHTKFVGHIYPG